MSRLYYFGALQAQVDITGQVTLTITQPWADEAVAVEFSHDEFQSILDVLREATHDT